jgi:hypothetical protein
MTARQHAWKTKWAPAARQALLQNGYEPIPLVGKRPVLDAWQNSHPTVENITTWQRTYPNATNTGILTRHTPAIDDDVLDQEVADSKFEIETQLRDPTVARKLHRIYEHAPQ